MGATGRFGLACAVLIATTTSAHADWYYTYSCSGACAPDQIAAVATSPGFGSQAACEAARDGDWRRNINQQSGSLGGLSLCFESDTPPSPDGSGAGPKNPPPFQSFAIGLMGGPGYRPANEMEGKVVAGLDVGATFGGKPIFGLVFRTGLRGSHFDSDATTKSHFGMFWPLMLGITLAPGSRRTRLEVGADGGLEISIGCKGCPGGALVGVVRGGLVHYFKTIDLKRRGDRSGRAGLALEVLREYRSGFIEGSQAMLRLSFRMGNDLLEW